jgi:hypothetical protein
MTEDRVTGWPVAELAFHEARRRRRTLSADIARVANGAKEA